MNTRNSNKSFDPFNDRVARNIRNSLSEAFIASVKRSRASLYLAAIEKWYRRDLPHPLRDYVHDREKSYNQIYQQIEFDKPQNPLIFAVCLWNAQLFFEFHEHLEDIWHSSKGKKRQALQGLIKAAGAYIHLEAGNHDAAQSLAKKSMQLISAHQAELAFISNLDALIAELESIHQPPPLLTITNVTRTK